MKVRKYGGKEVRCSTARPPLAEVLSHQLTDDGWQLLVGWQLRRLAALLRILEPLLSCEEGLRCVCQLVHRSLNDLKCVNQFSENLRGQLVAVAEVVCLEGTAVQLVAAVLPTHEREVFFFMT